MFVIMLQKEIEPVSKPSKSSSSDLEIEIAELLYGLKTSKSHESSKKFEASVSPSDDGGGFHYREIFSFMCLFFLFLFFSFYFNFNF